MAGGADALGGDRWLGLHVARDGQERPHAEVLLQEAQLRQASTGAPPLPPDVVEALSLRTLRFL